MIEKNAKIYVAGHKGMVGSAIVRELERQGYHNLITRTHKELDLLRQDAVEEFFAEEKPEVVVLAAAKVGGIVANQSALADLLGMALHVRESALKCLLAALSLPWMKGLDSPLPPCPYPHVRGESSLLCIPPSLAPLVKQLQCVHLHRPELV